jgi:hypothetical protein
MIQKTVLTGVKEHFIVTAKEINTSATKTGI